LRQSTDFFAKLGVDYLVVIDFSPDFSKLTGEAFIARCCSMFAVKAVVIGENFRCGSSAQTGPKELAEIVPKCAGGAVVIVPPMYRISDGTEDSSTLVRTRLTQGNISEVSELLGRNYSLDLAPLPSRDNEYPLRFPIGSFIQLLPPPGLYDTMLIAADRSETRLVTTVDEEFLTLMSATSPALSGGRESRGVPERFDNLEFIKELSPLC
jgi:riboflavin kinase / FMN adenylyltransferase